MSEQKVPRSMEQRIVIKFLVGENVPSAEIHHRLQQQYGEECLRRKSVPVIFEPPCNTEYFLAQCITQFIIWRKWNRASDKDV